MFIKIRRDTLIILLLAFILILCGRLITYVAFASSTDIDDGIPISGVIVKGNDIVPADTVRYNVMQAGFRDGSVIYDDILKTSKREVSLQDAIQTAQEFATRSTVPGTSVEPITAADVPTKYDETFTTPWQKDIGVMDSIIHMVIVSMLMG